MDGLMDWLGRTPRTAQAGSPAKFWAETWLTAATAARVRSGVVFMVNDLIWLNLILNLF